MWKKISGMAMSNVGKVFIHVGTNSALKEQSLEIENKIEILISNLKELKSDILLFLIFCRLSDITFKAEEE